MESGAIAGRTEAAPSGVPPAEFRQALERALAEADGDERIGPLLRATKMRLRFAFPDCGLVLNVASEGGGARHLRWSFAEDPGWQPELELEMDAEVGNRFLQGRESLAIAIARGRARLRGPSRVALLVLPATRLICGAYRRVIDERFPSLALR